MSAELTDAEPQPGGITERADEAERFASAQERHMRGRQRRGITLRRALARVPKGNRDPMGILEEQNARRVPELLPLRRERMSASVFTFYRGTAAIMAADLARQPHSGIYVASCGDAHVSNFGFYASAQRTLLFDLNDFDEAAWAPWEWDLKRLVTSVILAGQATARNADVVVNAARATIRAYLRALRSDSTLDPLTRYYLHFDTAAVPDGLDTASRRVLKESAKDARRRTGKRAARRLTARDPEGRLRFVESPPAMTRADSETIEFIHDSLRSYLSSANVDVQLLMRQYRIVDAARRAVGVGSVGTRCYVFLLQDADGNSMVLQAKQAGRSVLEEHGRINQPAEVIQAIAAGGEGQRVVGLQRILQAHSDPFLGYLAGVTGDYYVRQFHDMKGGIEMETLDDGPFRQYAESCGVVLARAHAQSGTGAEILGYAGTGKAITGHLIDWCEAYAVIAARDYEEFLGRGRSAAGSF